MERLTPQEYIEIAALAAEESTDCIYLSDPKTYELLFINKTCLRLLGDPPEEEWLGKPCYQVLQGHGSPCPFCNNHTLGTESFYCWEHYNTALGCQFIMRDKLVDLNGRLVRLEIASDVTYVERANAALYHQLHTEKTLMECVRCLSSDPSLDGAADRLLPLVGNYYNGDRAYIFNIDQEAQVAVNTNEWCRDGVSSKLQDQKALPLASIAHWMTLFHANGSVNIPDAGTELDSSSAALGASRAIAVPLTENEQIVGFVGVDDPTENFEDLTLLHSLSSYMASELTRRKMTQRLQYLSYTDVLTGAGNRRKYTELVKELEDRPPAALGVIYLDINGLKQVNDLYGHEYGDHLLHHTGQVLLELCPGEVCRVGGDEFIILCPDISRKEFDALINDLYTRASQDHDFNPSLGTSWREGPEISVSLQISNSDRALSVDKQGYYLRKLEGQNDYHVLMTQQLHDEISSGSFGIHLQPQIDLRTGSLRGAEALVRRWDEHGQSIPPLRFIPLFEAEGLVRHVDFFVLETVCATLQEWMQQNKYALPPIAVNFSRVTMMEHDIVPKLLEVCEKHHIPPTCIKIEVTESIGCMDPSTLDQLIHALGSAGFSISLDDFGAEYSNLALLSSTQFDELKLDKSLIDRLGVSQNAHIVTAHTIEVCRELGGIVSVAEGIEHQVQRDILTSLGCKIGQGFLFDRPLDPERFAEKYIYAAAT